jgi:hypothetical protein
MTSSRWTAWESELGDLHEPEGSNCSRSAGKWAFMLGISFSLKVAVVMLAPIAQAPSRKRILLSDL